MTMESFARGLVVAAAIYNGLKGIAVQLGLITMDISDVGAMACFLMVFGFWSMHRTL